MAWQIQLLTSFIVTNVVIIYSVHISFIGNNFMFVDNKVHIKKKPSKAAAVIWNVKMHKIINVTVINELS